MSRFLESVPYARIADFPSHAKLTVELALFQAPEGEDPLTYSVVFSEVAERWPLAGTTWEMHYWPAGLPDQYTSITGTLGGSNTVSFSVGHVSKLYPAQNTISRFYDYAFHVLMTSGASEWPVLHGTIRSMETNKAADASDSQNVPIGVPLAYDAQKQSLGGVVVDINLPLEVGLSGDYAVPATAPRVLAIDPSSGTWNIDFSTKASEHVVIQTGAGTLNLRDPTPTVITTLTASEQSATIINVSGTFYAV